MLLWDNIHLWAVVREKNTNCSLKRAIAFKGLEKIGITAKNTLKYLTRILEMGLMNLFKEKESALVRAMKLEICISNHSKKNNET